MQAPATAAPADPIARLILDGHHREAVACCAREHGAALGRLCMALLGDQAEAEETVQDTLIDAHRAMGGFRAHGSVRGWLSTIARRKCARRLETRGRREAKLRLVHDAGDAPAPDGLLDAQRRAVRVRAALAELRPSERDAVVLRYQSGLAYREIGEVCGIDEAAARKRVSRALGRLRALLKDDGDAY